MKKATGFLEKLNKEYFELHHDYEEYFWTSYMGDHSVDKKMNLALEKRDYFRSNTQLLKEAKALLADANRSEMERLKIWIQFFEIFQAPKEAQAIKNKINKLETKILKERTVRKEGYINPHTKKFVPASAVKMSMMIRTNSDEAIRRACYQAREKLAQSHLKEYVELVNLRNKYARTMGYKDFYDFKVQSEDGMTKNELFTLFEQIYKKTRYAFQDIRKLEEDKPNLRKPWNFAYMMAGDFTKEEDPYFQFEEAILRWGQSFSALNIDYQRGTLTLDLLDRKGKWNNGFCHWPNPVHYEDNVRMPGTSNFTCNVVAGQVGSGIQGYITLFHEGGHAAHLLNSKEREVLLNQEYTPMATSWAETQSMFLDTLFSSIEWKRRYAKDKTGKAYPFELFERKVRKLHALRPTRINSILFVANFERDIYEMKNLTTKKVLDIAKKNHKKYNNFSEASLGALNVPHIYNWESACAYHGYGLAELALTQWRDYFYKKYGYLVDNPKVGKEMSQVWKLGALKTYKEFVVLATGKNISPSALIKEVTQSIEETLQTAKRRLARMKSVKPHRGRVRLNALVRMVDGKKEISNNKKNFEDMALKYKKWVMKQNRVKK